MLLLQVILLFVWNLKPTSGAISHILKPIRDGYKVVLFIIPTDGVPGQAYKPLADKIQETSPLSLWVVLFDDFTDGQPSITELSEVMQNTTAELEAEGLQNVTFIIAAHGQGGIVVVEYIQDYYQMFSGLILYATKIPEDYVLKDYLLPTLTLSGDMDGVVRMTKLLNMYIAVQKQDAENFGSFMFRSLFMVLPGVNHSQFASGPMPNYIKNYDIKADLDDEAAHELIANFTSAFMVSTLIEPEEAVSSANAFMQDAMNYTQDLLKPLLHVKSMDHCVSLYYCWLRKAQTSLISMSDPYSQTLIDALEINKMKLLTENPVINYMDASLNMGIYATVTYDKPKLNVPDCPQAVREIQTRMVQQSTAKRVFPGGHYAVVNQTCISLNKKAYQYALSLASNHSLQRMHKRGRQVYFLEDIRHRNELTWLETDIKLEMLTYGLTVQSSSYYGITAKTNVSFLACNLLTPFKAMEYIYIDSLK